MAHQIDDQVKYSTFQPEFLIWEPGIGKDFDLQPLVRLFEKEITALRRELDQRKHAEVMRARFGLD